MTPLEKAKRDYKTQAWWSLATGLAAILLFSGGHIAATLIWSLLHIWSMANTIIAWKAIGDLEQHKNTIPAQVYRAKPTVDPSPAGRVRKYYRQRKLMEATEVVQTVPNNVAVCYYGMYNYRVVCMDADCATLDSYTNHPFEELGTHVEQTGKDHGFFMVSKANLEAFLEAYAGETQEGS